DSGESGYGEARILMRIPFTLTLFEKPAPEDGELQVSWDIQASANVRWATATWNEPGEQLIEDIQIDAVSATWLTYGHAGSVIVPAAGDSLFARRETDRTLNWLRAQLAERDEWLERMSGAAARRATELGIPETRPCTSWATKHLLYGVPESLRREAS
ncbi:MAG: hypothetical protein JWN70_4312, partial [Planctomycetaceae bacterium]|nr:hypothetical protein [Planctomycetaceae bacterium]